MPTEFESEHDNNLSRVERSKAFRFVGCGLMLHVTVGPVRQDDPCLRTSLIAVVFFPYAAIPSWSSGLAGEGQVVRGGAYGGLPGEVGMMRRDACAGHARVYDVSWSWRFESHPDSGRSCSESPRLQDCLPSVIHWL